MTGTGPLYALDGAAVELRGGGHYVAPGATLIGRVVLEDRATVWFGAIARADNEPIVIGDETNLQDGVVLHVDPGFPLSIGRGVTVGHQAMLHGCTIGDGSLIGIQAVVLNNAKIGRNCLVGAGALVTEGKEFPDGSLIMGAPAKVVGQLTPERFERLRQGALSYAQKADRFRRGLKKIG